MHLIWKLGTPFINIILPTFFSWVETTQRNEKLLFQGCLILELCFEFFFSTSGAVKVAFGIGFPLLFLDQGGLVLLLLDMKFFLISMRHIYNASKEKLQEELQQWHTRVHRGYTKVHQTIDRKGKFKSFHAKFKADEINKT